MPGYRAAVSCLVLSVILSVVCHPRIFFGPVGAGGSAVFSLDQLFFWGQWIALALAIISLLASGSIWLNSERAMSPAALWVPAFSALLCGYLVFTGIPHPANSGSWSNRELGIGAFMRGQTNTAKANAKPVKLNATAFRGDWQSPDGTIFTFDDNRVIWKNGTTNGEYSSSACDVFTLDYVEKERAILNDLGLTWSQHAVVVFEATTADAKIPVAEVACGKSDRLVFIRASETEVWRWTNSLNANDITNDSFILRPVR